MPHEDDFGERFGHFIGLDELGSRLFERLDRIERRLDRLNITPADLAVLEEVRASLGTTDQTLDAIEPTAGDAT